MLQTRSPRSALRRNNTSHRTPHCEGMPPAIPVVIALCLLGGRFAVFAAPLTQYGMMLQARVMHYVGHGAEGSVSTPPSLHFCGCATALSQCHRLDRCIYVQLQSCLSGYPTRSSARRTQMHGARFVVGFRYLVGLEWAARKWARTFYTHANKDRDTLSDCVAHTRRDWVADPKNSNKLPNPDYPGWVMVIPTWED